MSTQYVRPKWWQLYMIFPLIAALFIFDNHLKLSTRGHIGVQLGILVLIFGLVHLWLKANSAALSKMDPGQNHGKITVIQILPYKLEDDKRPVFQLPETEIKGLLSNTFEMDYIDSEFLPNDEISQEIDKE